MKHSSNYFKVLLFITLHFVFYSANAQENNSGVLKFIKKTIGIPASDYDTSYIYQFKPRFVLKPLIAYRDFNLNIIPTKLSDYQQELKLKYKKRENYYFGIGATNYNIQAQLFLKIPLSKKDKELNASNKCLDINLAVRSHKWSNLFYYKNFIGFYSETNLNNENQYVMRGDIEVLEIGTKSFYVLNDKFSLNAIYKQTRLQKKNIGSFLIRADAYYSKITSDSSIFISEKQKTYYSDINNFLKIEYYVLNLQAGYVYNYIFSHSFYISPIIFIGIGPQQMQFDNPVVKQYSLNYALNYRLLAGYSRKHFLTGIVVDAQYYYTPIKSAMFFSSSLYIKLTAGYRF